MLPCPEYFVDELMDTRRVVLVDEIAAYLESRASNSFSLAPTKAQAYGLITLKL
jgi:hypothetical protein